MPNLNVTLSQPHVEDRMKKVLMVEETMDTPNHHIFLYGIQNDSPLACILFAYYFKQIASELQQDCTTLLLIYKYRSGVKEKRKGVIWRDTGKYGTNLWHLFKCQL